MQIRYLILLFLLAFPFTNIYAIQYPALTGRVVDNAHIIDPLVKKSLENILAEHEKNTSDQIVVVTLQSLQGYTIEEFGYQLGRKWGVGTKEKNNGVLLIVAPNEREMRIEVGYGLEGYLTDAKSKIIIENEIIPYFKKGDYSGGVLNGTKSIIKVLNGDYVVTKKRNARNNSTYEDIFIIVFVLFSIYLIFFGSKGGGSSGRGGGSFGGGGFSGGGGSFGGGGSSGRW